VASIQIITDDQGNTGSGGPLTDTNTVSITVNSINDAPTVPDSSIVTDEDVPYLAALGVNDLLIASNDVDGDTLTVTTTPIAAPSNGLLVLNSDGTFTYTPNANFFGTDAFTYEITDGNGGTAQATVMIDVTSVNDAPTVSGSAIALDEDIPYAATLGVNDLLINSVDIDGDTLTVSSTPVTGPSNGVLILSGTGTFTYTPNADFNGSDSFVYQIVDGNGGSAQALVTINVASINDAPVALDDALNAQPNTSGLIDGDLLIANDMDVEGDTLTLVGLTQPTSGFVALNPDGTIVYIPNGGFVGLDSFTYTVSDPSGAQATGLVVIDVSTVDEDAVDDGSGDGGITVQAIEQGVLEDDEPEQVVVSSEKPVPSVSLLVTPDSELSTLDFSTSDEDADLLLLVGGEVDDSGADLLIAQAQSLYSQALNQVGGLALGSFELASLDPASLAQALDSLRREISGLEGSDEFDSVFVLQVSTGLGAVLSVGFVSWVLRGGALAATLLSTVPMWRGFDPLPMLMGRRKTDEEQEHNDELTDDEQINSGDTPTTQLRELHLERMFSTSGRFKSDKLTGKTSK